MSQQESGLGPLSSTITSPLLHFKSRERSMVIGIKDGRDEHKSTF